MGMEQDGNLGPLAADARPSTPASRRLCPHWTRVRPVRWGRQS